MKMTRVSYSWYGDLQWHACHCHADAQAQHHNVNAQAQHHHGNDKLNITMPVTLP
jgi:hypothetical protein